MVKVIPDHEKEVYNALREMDGIKEVYNLFGEYDLFVILEAQCQAELGHIFKRIRGLSYVLDTWPLLVSRAIINTPPEHSAIIPTAIKKRPTDPVVPHSGRSTIGPVVTESGIGLGATELSAIEDRFDCSDAFSVLYLDVCFLCFVLLWLYRTRMRKNRIRPTSETRCYTLRRHCTTESLGYRPLGHSI